MTTYRESERTWWDSAKRFILYGAIIAIAIWFFTIATGARSLAQSNAELVSVPIYQLTMVPGGPIRFADEFEDALEDWADQTGADAAETPALEPADYLWMTLVVRNIREQAGTDLAVELNTVAPIQQLFFAVPGFSVDSAIEFEAGAQTATVTFEALDKDDEALLFIAMNPQAFETPYSEESHRLWARTFESYFQRVQVESDLAEARLYGHGYVVPEEETEQS